MRTTPQIVCLATVAVLISAGPAGAATPGPGAPSIDQYIEAIPTSSGPQPVASIVERVQPLTREAEQRVETEAGSDAEALTKIATSSRYGAPVATEGDGSAAPLSTKPAETDQDDTTVALGPPAQAAEGSESRLVGLIAFMAGSLVTAVAYAGIRRRSREPDRSAS